MSAQTSRCAAARQWVQGTKPLQGVLLVVLYFFLLFTIISEHVAGILKYGQVTQLVSLVLAKRQNRFTAPDGGFSSVKQFQ